MTQLEGQPVIHRPKATALLAAMLLTALMPAATTFAATPMNTNLLRNPGFERIPTDASIPKWESDGDARVLRFGTESWPDQAYGTRWGGGKRYLDCARNNGLVRQDVPFSDSRTERAGNRLNARLEVDFGGTTGHQIRVSLLATGGEYTESNTNFKTLEVTNHYKVIVVSIPDLPVGTTNIEVKVELIKKSGATNCKMVADTLSLIVTRP